MEQMTKFLYSSFHLNFFMKVLKVILSIGLRKQPDIKKNKGMWKKQMIFQKYGDMPEWPITTSEIAIPRAISMVLSLLITFGVADDDIIYYFNGRIFTLKRT